MWLLKVLDKIELPHVKEEAKAILYAISLIKRDNEFDRKKPCSLDRIPLFEGGLMVINASGKTIDKIRMFVHFALEAIRKGLPKSALEMLKGTAKIYESPTPPEYYDELLYAINAQIIIQVKDNDVGGALQGMHRRLDVVSKWIGNASFELADCCYRIGCFYSTLCQHENCVKYIEESLRIGTGYDDFNTLDCIKLLATTYEAMEDTERAICKYKDALSIVEEEDFSTKSKLLNALSHLLVKVNGQCQLAIDYLEQSIHIQQNDTNAVRANSTYLLDTMVLCGMASSFSKAIGWYESALRSNPDKSAIHSINLRARYNKGVTLFRSGDIGGMDHAFRIIIDGVETKPALAPSETASILHGIGSLYFVNKKFATAIKCFAGCLSLRNDYITLCQRAGILCNIGSAYYKMQNYEESENFFNEALMIAEPLDETSFDIKPAIMCKLAYILYRRKNYLYAQKLFNEGMYFVCKSDILCHCI